MRGLFGSLAIIVALIGGGMAVAGLVYWNVIMVGPNGIPLDTAGASPPCYHCGYVYTRSISRYGYRCEKCQREFTCRSDERNRFVYGDE